MQRNLIGTRGWAIFNDIDGFYFWGGSASPFSQAGSYSLQAGWGLASQFQQQRSLPLKRLNFTGTTEVAILCGINDCMTGEIMKCKDKLGKHNWH
jgi:hypothetical protein